MRRERVDLSVVLGRAAEAVRAQVAERRQELDVELPPAPLWADADPTRLEQVFVNLLNNASKYSHDGGRIWFSAVQAPAGAEVRVRDEGIGLDPAMAKRVFDLFAQAQTGLDRAKGGLGIGLSLAQRLTELHSGSIRVHSEGLGRGAEFVVTLPLAESVAQAAEAQEMVAPAAATPLYAKTVLLVDDNVDATRALALLLEHAGFNVVTAHDGGEALVRADETQPDIVLLDLGLPVVDGYRVAETLRARPGGKALLLVAISGYGQPEDRQRSHAVGFDHHLVKPIDCDVLLALMRNGARTWDDALGTQHSVFGPS
jgi:CheY-like chemotaxis protein